MSNCVNLPFNKKKTHTHTHTHTHTNKQTNKQPRKTQTIGELTLRNYMPYYNA